MDTKEVDTKEEDTKEEKEEKVCISVDVPVFDKNDYFGWRAKRKPI